MPLYGRIGETRPSGITPMNRNACSTHDEAGHQGPGSRVPLQQGIKKEGNIGVSATLTHMYMECAGDYQVRWGRMIGMCLIPNGFPLRHPRMLCTTAYRECRVETTLCWSGNGEWRVFQRSSDMIGCSMHVPIAILMRYIEVSIRCRAFAG